MVFLALIVLAGILTVFAWKARFIVVSMASALVWFAMGAIIMISPSTFDMGTWGTQWTIMLAMVFILMTFAPLLLQMRTDIRHEQVIRGKTMTWTTSGHAPNGKLTRREESQMRQADFRRGLRNRWSRKP